MFVKIFRHFFYAHEETHDLGMAKLERLKVCIKALSDLNKFFCKELSAPFTKIYSFLNFLSLDNKKFKTENKGENFWELSSLKLSEKGFESFEAQANYLLQPLCAALATSRVFLDKFDSEKKIFGESSYIYKALSLFSIAEIALTILYLARKSIKAKKSWISLVKLYSKENTFSQDLKTQAYQTILEVQSAALKFFPFIAKKQWIPYIKIAQTCVNLLKVPSKLDKYSLKVKKAQQDYEAAIFTKLKELDTKKDLNEFLKEYKSLYQQVVQSSNTFLLIAFFKALQERELSLKATSCMQSF
jgi:hypothetical protein